MTGSNLSRIESVFFSPPPPPPPPIIIHHLLSIVHLAKSKIRTGFPRKFISHYAYRESIRDTPIYTHSLRLAATFHRIRQTLPPPLPPPCYLAVSSPFRNLRKAAYSRVAQHPATGGKSRRLDKPRGASGWGLALPLTPLLRVAPRRSTSQCTSNKLSAPVITLRLRDLLSTPRRWSG